MIYLAHIKKSPTAVRYILVECFKESKTWKVSCMGLSTLYSRWKSLAQQEKDSLNFTFDNGVLKTHSTVLVQEISEDPGDFSFEYTEKTPNIWEILAQLLEMEALVCIYEDTYVPIRKVKFSKSTPNITIGGYVGNKFESIVIWSFDKFIAFQPIEIWVKSEHSLRLASSQYSEYIRVLDEVNSNGVEYTRFLIDLYRIPSQFCDKVPAMLTICPEMLVQSIRDAEVCESFMSGINAAYKLMIYDVDAQVTVNKSEPRDSSQLSPKNLIVKKKYPRTTLAKFNRVVFNKETSYYRDLIKRTNPEDYAKMFRTTVFDNPAEVLAESFAEGFSMVYNQDGHLLSSEYMTLSTKCEELMFQHNLEWFKYKTAILEYDIEGVCGIPFSLFDGYLGLDLIYKLMGSMEEL